MFDSDHWWLLGRIDKTNLFYQTDKIFAIKVKRLCLMAINGCCWAEDQD